MTRGCDTRGSSILAIVLHAVVLHAVMTVAVVSHNPSKVLFVKIERVISVDVSQGSLC